MRRSRAEPSAGTAASFREFVVSRSPGLLRAAYLLTGDPGKAEDLLQIALVKTWRHWRRVDRRGGREAYVRRVLYTTYAAWWRRRWRPTEESEAAPPDRLVSEDRFSSIEERITLMHALARLPARQRAVIVLRFYEDLGTAETADLLGCSAGTVKNHVAKALHRLRRSPGMSELRTGPSAR